VNPSKPEMHTQDASSTTTATLSSKPKQDLPKENALLNSNLSNNNSLTEPEKKHKNPQSTNTPLESATNPPTTNNDIPVKEPETKSTSPEKKIKKKKKKSSKHSSGVSDGSDPAALASQTNNPSQTTNEATLNNLYTPQTNSESNEPNNNASKEETVPPSTP
jgi:hypothetical protein